MGLLLSSGKESRVCDGSNIKSTGLEGLLSLDRTLLIFERISCYAGMIEPGKGPV